MRSCRDPQCVDPAFRAHHDRLLAVETDDERLLELFELAVTWDELDYSGELLIGPGEWPEFVERHHWADPERMSRIFSLAIDIASRSGGVRIGTGPVPDLVGAR